MAATEIKKEPERTTGTFNGTLIQGVSIIVGTAGTSSALFEEEAAVAVEFAVFRLSLLSDDARR